MHEYACLFRTLIQNYHRTISFDYSNHQVWPFCSDSKITIPSRRKSSERSQETLKGRERSLSCENKTILGFIQKLFEGAIKIWCLWNLFLWPNFSTFRYYWQPFTLCTPFRPWRQNLWCIALLVLSSACTVCSEKAAWVSTRSLSNFPGKQVKRGGFYTLFPISTWIQWGLLFLDFRFGSNYFLLCRTSLLGSAHPCGILDFVSLLLVV